MMEEGSRGPVSGVITALDHEPIRRCRREVWFSPADAEFVELSEARHAPGFPAYHHVVEDDSHFWMVKIICSKMQLSNGLASDEHIFSDIFTLTVNFAVKISLFR
jgi:hypothetical protein